MVALEPPRCAWFLDPDRESAERLAREVRTRIPGLEILTFDDPVLVVRRFQVGNAVAQPQIFVTDRLGVKPLSPFGLPAPVNAARQFSPWTAIKLHSHSAYRDTHEPGLVDRLWRERLIDRTEEKPDDASVLESVEACVHPQPILVRLRSYIAASPTPDLPFFPDERSEYLSLRDIYRRIACRGPRADELARLWELTLSDRPLDMLLQATGVP